MWIRYNGHLRLLIGIIHSVRLPISDTARDVTFKRPEERKRRERKKKSKKKNKKKKKRYALEKFYEIFVHFRFTFSFRRFETTTKWREESGKKKEKKERKRERTKRKKNGDKKTRLFDMQRVILDDISFRCDFSLFFFFYQGRGRSLWGNENAVFEDSGGKFATPRNSWWGNFSSGIWKLVPGIRSRLGGNS